MGDTDYGTDRFWAVSVASPHTLLLLLSHQKTGRDKPRCDRLRSLGTAGRPIQKTEAATECANSDTGHLLSCWFDKEAALFILWIHLEFFLALILFPNNPFLFSHMSSLKVSEGNKSQLPL